MLVRGDNLKRVLLDGPGGGHKKCLKKEVTSSEPKTGAQLSLLDAQDSADFQN